MGGQGVYVRQLSDALVVAGQEVTVFSGQPYPDLGPDVNLHPVSSLDLYRPDDLFRRPARRLHPHLEQGQPLLLGHEPDRPARRF